MRRDAQRQYNMHLREVQFESDPPLIQRLNRWRSRRNRNTISSVIRWLVTIAFVVVVFVLPNVLR